MKLIIRSLFLVIIFLLGSCNSYKPPPPAPLVNFAPTLKVQEVWAKTISRGTSGEYLKLNPVISNGQIFANSYKGYIIAIDATTGHKIWSVNAKLRLTSGLAANKDMLFAGDDQGHLVAFKQNGIFAWWTPMTSQILATPVVAGNIVLVKAENGELSAFNVDNGRKWWTYTNEEPSLILRGGSSPQVFGKKVITGFANGELVALDLNSGQFIWRELIAEGRGSMAVQRMVDIDVNPAIYNGVIYTVTYQGKIAAIRLKTGKILWQHKLSSYSGLAVDNDRVYVSDDQGHVWAFNRTTGHVQWKQSYLTNRKVTGPALVGNAVVVGDGEGYLHFMSQIDGRFIARAVVRKNDPIIAEPIAYDNNIFIYTAGGVLARFLVG
jgi:outer membrane protein assembly factor BamB